MSDILTNGTYVVQIADDNTTYNIKDAQLKAQVESLQNRLHYYRGTIENLTTSWFSSNPLPETGLYIVLNTNFSQDVEIIDNGQIAVAESENENYGRIDWMQEEESDDESSQLKTTNDYTYANKMTFPLLLSISYEEDNETTIQNAIAIDANGIVWRRVQAYSSDSTEYVWVNLMDAKANIKDYLTLKDKVNNLESLYDRLNALEAEVARLKAAQQVESLIIEGSDPLNDGITNILIVGDNNEFEIENNKTMPDLIHDYLQLKGTVVWIKNNSTKEALKYFVKYTIDGNETIATLAPTANIIFSSNTVNGASVNSLKINKFDIILILINKNDVDPSTNIYGSGNDDIGNKIGKYQTESINIIPNSNGEIIWIDDNDHSKGWISIPSSIKYNTIIASLQAIIQAIRANNSNAIIQVVSPVMWFNKNNNAIADAQMTINNKLNTAVRTLCEIMNVIFNDLYRMINDATKIDVNGTIIDETSINNYVIDLCHIINGTKPQGQMITVLADFGTNTVSEKITGEVKDISSETTNNNLQHLVLSSGSKNRSQNRSQIIQAPTSGSGTLQFIGTLSASPSYNNKVFDASTEYALRLYRGSSPTVSNRIDQMYYNTWNSGEKEFKNGSNNITWSSNDQFYVEFVEQTQFSVNNTYLNKATIGATSTTVTYHFNFEANFIPS